ncbi:MAG: DUF2971 domain-containing protein [Proteobacteria bacterium]|nr:DUF2971 domain-containing protein [Pseudomonadota bacterium]
MPDPQLIHEKHDFLWHYTSAEGLKGILESQRLWAFHYTHLNDSTEISHLRNELAQRLQPKLKELINTLRGKSFRAKRATRKLGGIKLAANIQAQEFVGRIFEATFSDSVHGYPICDPYIVSFCSHLADDDHERKNGLLSQWRSYAEGGYAIVFDTLALWKLLEREDKESYYMPLSLGDVVYEGDEAAFQLEFDRLMATLEEMAESELRGKILTPENLYSDVVSAFTRFKHQGFKEEREVRIVASPLTFNVYSGMKREHEDLEERDRALKQFQLRRFGVEEKRFIELFDFKEDHPGLPIRRIIVGPHRNQDEMAQQAREWSKGMGIEITRSDTPYIGRK